jgi:hypothetical protein
MRDRHQVGLRNHASHAPAIARRTARGYNGRRGEEPDALYVRHLTLLVGGAVSTSQRVVAIAAGVAVSCVSFVVGISLAFYVTGSWSASWLQTPSPPLDSPTALQVSTPSPSASQTPAPTITATRPLPTPTSTWVVPPLPSVIVPPRQPASPDEWEPDDNPGEARPLEPGVAQEHNLHTLGDQDWLYFEAASAQSYEIQTSSLGSEVDTVVSIYDGQGSELAVDDDGGDEFRSSRLFWSPQEDQRLYVMVWAFMDAQGGSNAQYSVSLRLAEGFRVDEYEPDDSAEQATRVEIGETQRHNRHVSADEDWISFRAEPGQTYVIATSRLGERADTVLYLYDREGNELALDDDGGQEERASWLEWTAPSPGLFFVRIANWLPIRAGPGTGYDLTLSVAQAE